MHLKYLKQKKIRIIFIVLFLVSILLIIVIYFSNSVTLYAKIQAQNFSEQVIIDCINKNVIPKLEDSSFLISEKNESQDIIYTHLDTQKINILRNEISYYTDEIIENINEYEYMKKISIPFEYFFGLKSIFNIDFKIPILLECVGNQNVEINNKVISQGINTLIVQFNINIQIDMVVIMPLKKIPFETNVDIPIAYEILNGNVPYIYSN